jgi:NAD+ kinase
LEFLDRNGVNTQDITTFAENKEIDADVAFSVGGDGTFIRSVAKIARREIPLLGINAGRLGFLADVDGEKEIVKAVEAIASGNYKVEDRPLLKLSTDGKRFSKFNYAINEIAILKQDTSSMIAINTYINGEFVTKYQADGLIIATATGSTAYAMSVGGPIVVPQASNFIITPVAPHSLSIRPLVVTDDCLMELSVESRNGQFLISLDGRCEVFPEDIRLKVRKADFYMKTIRLHNHSFYTTIREKLMWGTDQRKY